MEWISVEERVPNEDENYNAMLCYFEGWDDMFFQRTLEYDFNFDEWSDHEGNIYNSVTHWMPLPSPPKENQT